MSDEQKLRFGIMSTGNIAKQFAEGVAGSKRCVSSAVGSRSQDSADQFAKDHNLANSYGSYEALLEDENIDAVYIGLPNTMHHEWTLKALAAGKHVLCEKPISAKRAEAEEMFDAAEKAGLVLVEAFMYRSHPLTKAYQQAIQDGVIGNLKLIRSSFCYQTNNIDDNIRFDPTLAGGALMDIGCYCVNFARMLAGCEPEGVSATGHSHVKGVDDYTVATMGFSNGVVSDFACGMSVQANNTALICGDAGYIEVPVPWKPPMEDAVYVIDGQIPPKQNKDNQARRGRETINVNCDVPLFGLEADDFAATVLDHAEPVISKADSLGNMLVLDELRRIVGLDY